MLDLANILFTVIYSVTVPENCQACPTYEELDLMYKDNTHPGVSGEIIDNVRTTPNMERDWLWYDQQGYDYVIYYDPPPIIVHRSLHITIHPDLPAYKMPKGISNSMNMSDSTVTFGEGRWVGNNCGSASISSKLWVSLLGDTMNYMNEGCKEGSTIFNENMTYTYDDNSLTKQNNVSQWQLDIQKYVEAWIYDKLN